MYTATLKDGRAIAIPNWPIHVALENLTNVGKVLGVESVINIAEINIPAVIVAIMNAKDPKSCASIIKNFVCQARIAGSKIELGTIDDMFDGNLPIVAELFAHVVHAQFQDFFVSGLVKEVSPSK